MIKKGFSIIELLIVIGIMGLLLSGGAIGYREYTKRQAVENMRRQVVSDLRQAQSFASTGYKPPDCTGSLDGYGFEYTSAPANYRIFAVCTPGDANGYSVITRSGSGEVTISPVSGNRLVFRSLSLGTTIPGGGNAVFRMQSVHDSNIFLDVTITASGEIR